MAFFKFRKSSPSQDGQPARSENAAPSETVESLRRRALYRLAGAFALVLAVIIGFPILFDTQPRPVTVDAPIVIPDRDHAPLLAPLPVPVIASAASAPQPAPSQTQVSAAASLSAGEEVVAATGAAAAVASSAASAPRVTPQTGQQEKPKTDQQTRGKQQAAGQQAAEKRKAGQAKHQREAADAARARALLEGRGATPAAAGSSASQDRPASAPAAKAGRYVVQIGAFADARSAQAARQKAERAGVKTYIQNVATSAGQRTRVRAGPFASRSEAEQALARLKQAGLTGSILSP